MSERVIKFIGLYRDQDPDIEIHVSSRVYAIKYDHSFVAFCFVWGILPILSVQVTYLVNSLWPGDAIWWHRSASTLVQVMACCLTAPSHHLNQWQPIIIGVLWHHLRQVLKITIPQLNLKNTLVKSFPHFPGANELKLTGTNPQQNITKHELHT